MCYSLVIINENIFYEEAKKLQLLLQAFPELVGLPNHMCQFFTSLLWILIAWLNEITKPCLVFGMVLATFQDPASSTRTYYGSALTQVDTANICVQTETLTIL